MNRRSFERIAAALATVLVAGTLAGCGTSGGAATSSTSAAMSPGGGSAAPAPGGATASPAAGSLTVFAAASLKGSFTEIGELFEQEKPGSTVTFSFAGSSDLVAQIIAGAPADVFASADPTTMTKAVDGDVVSGTPVSFATNTLTIVTPPGNPAGINGFADLANPDVAVVVCAPQVPCGAATEKLEAATGVGLTPVSEESAVTDVLNKVTTGEADAGLVYVTDASGAGDRVVTVSFQESASVVNTYPIATLSAAADPTLAEEFVALVTGPEGQQVLAAAGFRPAS
jgi:molybdate transport system substrate-binding protein